MFTLLAGNLMCVCVGGGGGGGGGGEMEGFWHLLVPYHPQLFSVTVLPKLGIADIWVYGMIIDAPPWAYNLIPYIPC